MSGHLAASPAWHRARTRRAGSGRWARTGTPNPSGELLPGFAEDWAEAARRQQRAELAEALASRSAAAERDGDPAAAARWSRLRCELDPLDEAAHADLLRQLAAAGDRAGALVAGRQASDRLRSELGVRPGPALRGALAEARGTDEVPIPLGMAAQRRVGARARKGSVTSFSVSPRPLPAEFTVPD